MLLPHRADGSAGGVGCARLRVLALFLHWRNMHAMRWYSANGAEKTCIKGWLWSFGQLHVHSCRLSSKDVIW